MAESGTVTDMEAETEALGVLLKRYRLEAGLTQEELAERAELSARSVSDIERGLQQYPQVSTLRRLADALGLTVEPRAAFLRAGQRDRANRRQERPPALPGRTAHGSTPKTYPTNLPDDPTPFVGREREIATVSNLLRQPGVRLVTLTGPGGVGKTRLALRVASALLSDFPDGVFLVSLAALSNPRLIPSALAQALGAKEQGETSLADALHRHLLVLDNFEHLLDAAPAVAELLDTCRELHLLVTSRTPLHLRREHEYPVPPLTVPDPRQLLSIDALGRYEAVALFVERAQAVKPDFALTEDNATAVGEICARLDGLPLAIELAAARTKLFPPRVLLQRLKHPLRVLTGGPRDLPVRQQTMRETIDWSYRLLGGTEKILFRRLSVFAGGCTLEATESVCLPGMECAGDVLESLTLLVDHGLLLVSAPEGSRSRFRMLEPIREYALDLLSRSGEEQDLRQAHAAYYLALAEEAEPELMGPDQTVWFFQLEQEHDNLRQALDWLLRHADTPSALRLAGTLWRFWMTRGYLAEGLRWLEQALQDGGASPALRAKALHGTGVLAFHRGEQERATALLDESLRLFRELDDRRGIALVQAECAYIANDRGDYDRSAGLYTQALDLFRDLGAKVHFAQTLNDLANVRLNQEEYELARELYTQALSLSQELGDTRAIAIALTNLGALADRLGEYDEAIALFTESLELKRDLGDEAGVALALINLAEVVWSAGDRKQAASLLAEALQLSRRSGNNRVTLFGLATLAAVSADQGRSERAARLWGAAEKLFDAAGIVIPPPILADYQERLAVPRRQLGEDRWAAEREKGRGMPLEAAVVYALEEDSHGS